MHELTYQKNAGVIMCELNNTAPQSKGTYNHNSGAFYLADLTLDNGGFGGYNRATLASSPDAAGQFRVRPRRALLFPSRLINVLLPD